MLRSLFGSRPGPLTRQTPASVLAAGFPLPDLYHTLWRLGLAELGPWRLLSGRAFLDAHQQLNRHLARAHEGAQGRLPPQVWLPVARRGTGDLLACLQVIPRVETVWLVGPGPQAEVLGELASFADWVRWAVEDVIRVDDGRAPATPRLATAGGQAPASAPSATTAQPETKRPSRRKLQESEIDLDFVSAEAGDQALTSSALRRYHERVKRTRGDGIYADMMFVLTQQRYPERMAKWLWSRILQHKRDMAQRLGWEVEVTVASLDFLNGHEHLVEGSLVLCREDELAEIAEVPLRDGLTGLLDQASFRERLGRELRRAERYNSPLSLLMLDIDHLKQINDRLGRLAGDRVLAGLGELLRAELRDVDVVARFGGEEFALCLPETGLEPALRLGDRLRARVKARFPDAPQVTISVGGAGFPEDGRAPAELLARADAALYEAKRTSRDRATSAERADPGES